MGDVAIFRPGVAPVNVMKNSTSIADFTFDGDGKRVKSVINGEIILFVGTHYEVSSPGSGQTITKYYLAGSQTVAMRKYTVTPSSTTLSYLLTDHLGSTSVVGALVSETRYKAWGEVRSTTAGKTLSTRHTYTGQYSMD